MATQVQSLFGLTPEMYQQAQTRTLQDQAMRFAQLSPAEKASMGFFSAGSQLGIGLAGLMGYQDPEMQRIKARQGLLGGIDMSDPDALRQAAQGADPEFAQRLIAEANRLELAAAETGKEQALAGKAEADTQASRAKAAADNLSVQGRAQFLMSRIEGLTPEMAVGLAQQPDAAAKLLETPAVPTQVVETAEGVILINKNTGQAIANLGKPVQRGTTVTVNPQLKMAPDVVGAINAFDRATETDQEMLQGAQRSKALINEAATANNSQTWEAARTTLAKTVGQDKLSNEDIRRTGVDPRLVQGALDWFNKKTVGVPGPDIQRQLFALASILEQDAAKRIDKKSQRTQAAARAAEFPGDPNLYFPPATPQGAGGTGAVDWNSLP
jgi:hypothetical protein